MVVKKLTGEQIERRRLFTRLSAAAKARDVAGDGWAVLYHLDVANLLYRLEQLEREIEPRDAPLAPGPTSPGSGGVVGEADSASCPRPASAGRAPAEPPPPDQASGGLR